RLYPLKIQKYDYVILFFIMQIFWNYGLPIIVIAVITILIVRVVNRRKTKKLLKEEIDEKPNIDDENNIDSSDEQMEE
ncbi:MAG: hypothetical protein ACTSVP_10750, partial [Candidatus Heimdallarchaeota archaeon]